MDRSVVACEVDYEGATDAGRDSFMRKKLQDVEQITGMLPVHRRNQFAAVHVLQRHYRNFQVCLQRLTRIRFQRSDPNRMDCAAHHEIDLDFDFDAVASHQQLGLARISRGRRMCLEALLLKACGGFADGFVDAPERLLARQSVVGKTPGRDRPRAAACRARTG